ncbi:MAG: methylenetetrahydrofolate reductase [NAD(P)H] [Terrimicrobiaceae bacterium]
MHVQDIFQGHPTTFSFEFFPPKTAETAESLYETIRELEPYQPHFVSVTYGAGGSTRELTHELVVRIKETTSLDPIPHLTCVCHKEAEITAILERYAQAGVSNILALGGDPPKGTDYRKSDDDFQHAADLVKFIRTFNESGAHPDKRGFGIGVAGFPEGHPGTPNRLLEMDYLKQKVDEGADYIVTQLFFDNRDFLDFRDRCELAGITVPIIAGIMPVTSLASMKRMAELAAGARFPARLLRALQRCDNDTDAMSRVGIHHASEQCRDLLENKVRGIHFYTLNRSDATKRIFESLGIKHSRFAEVAAS